MEKISDMIIDWTRDEEAKYQASLLAKEVDIYRSESTEKHSTNTTISRANSKLSKKESPSPDKGKKLKPKGYYTKKPKNR